MGTFCVAVRGTEEPQKPNKRKIESNFARDIKIKLPTVQRMKIIQKINVKYNIDFIYKTTYEIIHVQVFVCPAGGSIFGAALSTTVEEDHRPFSYETWQLP